MTATPIPRTLAMTAYADLDVSVIDELPPGRTPVQTVAISGERRAEVIERIRAACAEGRQAYWVCTLIEESEQLDAQAAESPSSSCRRGAAGPARRPGARAHEGDREAGRDARVSRPASCDLLVATTVIEVGVDVPNASLMVIENAERLGLAQLHQLRGRVGRGSAASSCVLLYQPPLSALARERLEVMRETNDGFRHRRKGPGTARPRRTAGHAPDRPAGIPRRRPGPRRRPAAGGAARRRAAAGARPRRWPSAWSRAGSAAPRATPTPERAARMG